MKSTAETFYGSSMIQNKNWSYDPTGDCLTKYNGESYSTDDTTSEYTINTALSSLDEEKEKKLFLQTIINYN